MNDSGWSYIWVELLLVFGGALAFGWWQLRDVARAQRKAARDKSSEGKPL
jgi:hypothetical protein